MNDDLPFRLILAAYFTAVAIFYYLRVTAIGRIRGRSPVLLFTGLQVRNGRIFQVFRTLIWTICVVRVPWPGLDAWLVPLAPLWRAEIMAGGLALLGLASAFIFWGHMALGEAWTSGFGPPPRLISRGPYRWFRHPMAAGIHAAQVGFFLALPSLFTLVCLIVGFWAIRRQARFEEAGLRATFGAAYDSFGKGKPF